MKKKFSLSLLVLLVAGTAFTLAVPAEAGQEVVTGTPARGVTRRLAPDGERPLIVVPPLETVKLSDTGPKDYNSYVLKISLYEKDAEGRWTLSEKRTGAFAQQSSAPGTVNWASLGFDDYVKARPGLANYDKMSMSEADYLKMRDAECNAIADATLREQCLEFRKNRRTEWLDGLLSKNDIGGIINETVAPLRGATYEVAAAPLEEPEREGVLRPGIAPNPCIKH